MNRGSLSKRILIALGTAVSLSAAVLWPGPATAAQKPPPSSVDLTVTATDSPDPYDGSSELLGKPASGITYRITLRNLNASKAATNVQLAVVEGGLVFRSAKASHGSCVVGMWRDLAGDMGYVECTIGSLSPSATVLVEIYADACVSAPFFQGYGMSAFEYHSERDPNVENSEAHESTTVLMGSTICE